MMIVLTVIIMMTLITVYNISNNNYNGSKYDTINNY